MFRSMNSNVSTVSSFVSKGPIQTLHHVSCSLSKIPYVGFSPVRLQTGIQLRPSMTRSWLKCEAHMHHKHDNLCATKAERPCPSGPKACLSGPSTTTALPVQRPLAHQALCCRSGLSLNKDLIENIVCQNYGASTGWECGNSRTDRMRAYLSDFEISYLRVSRFSFGVW